VAEGNQLLIECPLDASIDVLVVKPDEIDGLKEWGTHAFAVFGENVKRPFIVLDATLLDQEWFTQAHLLVVLAHEVAHIHTGSESEEMADLVGMMLLYRYGHDEALELHMAEYRQRMRCGQYEEEAA
jgi:predicted Zn-dependent protease